MTWNPQLALLAPVFGAALAFVAAEFLFWLKAKPMPAVIERIVTTVERSDSELGPPGERVSTGLRVTLRLDAGEAPRRPVVLDVGDDFPAVVGQRLNVMALDPKPAWIFWSAMVRRGDIGRPVFRLAMGLALIVALAASSLPILRAALSP